MSIYEIKQSFGVPVIAKDAPRRVTPPLANMETTLAAMKADAAAWKRRKSKAWGEGIELGNEALSRDRRFNWTDDLNEVLRADVLDVLRRNPNISQPEVHMRIRWCGLHKLRDVMAELRKEGRIKLNGAGNNQSWSLK